MSTARSIFISTLFASALLAGAPVQAQQAAERAPPPPSVASAPNVQDLRADSSFEAPPPEAATAVDRVDPSAFQVRELESLDQSRVRAAMAQVGVVEASPPRTVDDKQK